MATNIEEIKEIVTDVGNLQVDFNKLNPPDLHGEYTKKQNERIACYLFDTQTLLYIANLASNTDLVKTLNEFTTEKNIAIKSDEEVYYKAGDNLISSSCNIYKAKMYIDSEAACVNLAASNKAKDNDIANEAALGKVVAAKKKKKNDNKAAADVHKASGESNCTEDSGIVVCDKKGGGGNPTKIGSIYQSFCGLRFFDFEDKFKVFVMDKQKVVKIEFTDSIAYFSLSDTSGKIKFNENTPYFRIYKDGKKEYGLHLNKNKTLFIDDKNNMKFGEKDLTPDEVNQILKEPEPSSSSWSTYALPVAATATAAAGLAYLYKKSKRKPKKSKSTRRQSSSSSSSSSSSYRRPVKSSRKRKH